MSGAAGRATSFRVLVLGPVMVTRGGARVDVGGPRQRGLLTALALEANRPVSSDRLVELLWGEADRDGSLATLHVAVAKLRRVLGGGAGPIETVAPGYRLVADASTLDLLDFDDAAADARARAAHGDLDGASRRFREALALHRGTLAEDLADETFVRSAAPSVELARRAVNLDAIEIDLRLGRHRDVVVELERLVTGDPLDEDVTSLLMVALYRTGRQADALDVARRLRSALDEGLGVTPGPAFEALERAILRHDAAVVAPSFRVDRESALPSTAVRSGVDVPRAWLVLTDRRRVPIGSGATTIGRARDRSIVVDDPDVSRHHAEVRRSGAGCVLIDVGSTNGTRVNGEPVGTPRVLRDGDVIEVGSTALAFRTGDGSGGAD